MLNLVCKLIKQSGSVEGRPAVLGGAAIAGVAKECMNCYELLPFKQWIHIEYKRMKLCNIHI